MRQLKLMLSVVILIFNYSAVAENKIDIDFTNLNAPVPLDKSIQKGTLANGLTYYIKKNAKPEKRMELRLVVKAGAINEDADQNGIAHFVEHMLFNGTEHFPKNDLVHYLEKIGVRFGADLNAYTAYDQTVYQLPIPTDKPELIQSGFKILADWAGSATFKPDEIDKERGVVLEEWRLRQGAGMRASKVHRPTIYYGSKLEQHDVIGDNNVIQKAPYAVIKRFYQDWYRPDLMAVVVVGDIDVAQIEKQIKENFSALKNPAKERQLIGDDIEIKKNKEPLVSVYSDSEQTSTILKIGFKKPAEKQGSLAQYQHAFINRMAARMLGERINDLLQKKNPPFQYTGIGLSHFFGNTDSFSIYSNLNAENFNTGYRAALSEVFQAVQQGFGVNEYNRAKTNSLSQMEKEYLNRNKIESANFADEYIRNFIDNEPIPGVEIEYALVKKLTEAINVADINQAMQNYITEDNMFFTLTTAKKKGIETPTKEQLLATYQELKNTEFAAHIDDFSDKALFSKELKPGSIVKTTDIKEIGMTEFVLSNGIKVLVKPTTFNDSQILFQAFSKGGNSLVPIKEYLNGNFAADIVTSGGVANFNNITLQKILTGKNAGVYPYIGSISEGFSGSTTPKDTETLFQLLHLYFTQPHKDKDSFDAFITLTKQWIDDAKRNPAKDFYDSINYIMSGNDVHNTPLNKEMIEKLDMEKAYQIYQDRFADPSDFTFVFVGNIDMEKFKPLLSQYLASLSTKGIKENFKDIYNDKPKQAIKKDFHKGKEDKSYVILKINGDAEYNRKTIYTLNALEAILNYRLTDKLREDKGQVYSAHAFADLSRYPKSEYIVGINFGCKPNKAEAIIKTVKTILQDLKTNKPSDEDMQKVREANKRQYEISLKENNYWMSEIVDSYSNDLDVKDILHYPDLINTITKEDIKKAANQYFNLNTMKEFVLYPEK